MKFQYLQWFFYFFILWPVSTNAADFSPPFTIRQLGLEDGLPHRSTYASTHDRHHLLWLGTEAGLCRFDGYQISAFNHFPQKFSGSLKNDQDSLLLSIVPGYRDSLEIFDPVHRTASGKRLAGLGVGLFAGICHRSGFPPYFGQGATIYRYSAKDGKAVAAHTLKRELRNGDRLINASVSGYLLYRADQNDLEEFFNGQLIIHPPPSDSPIEFIFQEKSGKIWVGTEQNAFTKNRGQDIFRPVPPLPNGDPVNKVYEDDLGHIIVAHLQPYMLTMTDMIAYLGQDTVSLEGLLEEEKRVIHVDGHDFRQEIRAATHGGLYTLQFPQPQKSPFYNFLAAEDMPSGTFGHVMRGFTADNDGNVYANKDSSKPWWFRVNIKDYSLDTLLMQNDQGQVVKQFGCGTNLINHQGDIYGMSCYRGDVDTGHVYRYRPKTDSWRQWTLPEVNQVVRWIMKGRSENELMLITQDSKTDQKGQLYYFYPARDSFALVLPAGPEHYIAGYTKSAKADSARSCIWIASTRGLYRFNLLDEKLEHFTFPSGQATSISDIVIRKSGDLLLGTFKNGLQRFFPDQKQFEHVGGIAVDGPFVQKTDGFLSLPSSFVAAIQVTQPDNYLLITTFNGLYFHGPETSHTYTTNQGLPSNEFNTPSLFFNATDQRWYAGGINGFCSFKTDDLLSTKSPLEPLLLRYRLMDELTGVEKSIPLTPRHKEEITIRPNVSYFAFDFTLPDYQNAEARKYQTRLVGFDRDWRSATATNFVRYTQLPAGSYTFQVRAIDGIGRQTEIIREVPVTVLKPWYQKRWVHFLMVLGLAGILLTWHGNRLARLEKEHQAERRVQSLELRALRQQLNPHFISNAMNAIREYISSQEAQHSKKAGDYLTDFSQLMRLFLEASRKRFTSVADEVDMLERYLSLEQLRFPDKFDYRIEVNEDIDPDMDEIPSLLLQPLVENAINHGLSPRDKKGFLHIHFELEDDDEAIKCTISDDGVGRKIAAATPRRRDHISRSTQIMEDRRILLSEYDDIELRITMRDQFPEREHTGTVVTVRF
ncbi:histidine kinase [Neolewinella agarilytica]|uniref:sensor histidine kinase n=1 Tax=Neolewinella agarilytica TaxID=478744 RepID=UPI0023529C98|nr:histidine kinase [Neolewinella agarilytica]